MNRWHVYEWLKQSYMFSGRIPSIHEVRCHFLGQVESEELLEGVMEFQSTAHVMMPVDHTETEVLEG